MSDGSFPDRLKLSGISKMNKPLSDDEERAFEKLIKLRVGALYADERSSAMRIALEIMLFRMDGGKIDGAIWIASSSRAALVNETADFLLQGRESFVRVCTFQALSHNADMFFELLRLTENKRLMLLIDDGLYIKNVNAVRTHRVWMIAGACPYRLLLAGAPFERNQADMFPQWYALDARILGYISYWGFCANHIKKGKLVNGEYLSRAIAPYSACVESGEKEKLHSREYVWQFRLPEYVYDEYRRVAARFEKRAAYSKAGVYRMLSACHVVASGRKIVRDYPMETVSIYERTSDDPRLRALLDILTGIDAGRTLIVCRFHFEIEAVAEALSRIYGRRNVHTHGEKNTDAGYYVESLYLERRALSRKKFKTVIHYSHSWSLRKRRELGNFADISENTTVINLVAADTIDAQMVKCVWKKERNVEEIFYLLTGRKENQADAQDLQG